MTGPGLPATGAERVRFTVPVGSHVYRVESAPTGDRRASRVDHDGRRILVAPDLSPGRFPQALASAVAQAWIDTLESYGAKVLSAVAGFHADSEQILREEGDLTAEEAASWFASLATLRAMGVVFDAGFLARVDDVKSALAGGEDDEDADYHDELLEPAEDDLADRDSRGPWITIDPD